MYLIYASVACACQFPCQDQTRVSEGKYSCTCRSILITFPKIYNSDGANVALVIGNVCNEDVAEYACVTENVQDKTHLELKASETPALAKLPEVMAASRGKDVKLSCKLNNPNDKIQWQKRGKFLLDEKSKFSKYSVDRGILIHDSLQQTLKNMLPCPSSSCFSLISSDAFWTDSKSEHFI